MSSTKINLGKVALTPKGEWNTATTYERLDVVSYDGSSYTVLKECQGVVPVEGEFYSLLAMKGEKGEKGEIATISQLSEDALALGGINSQIILNGIGVTYHVSPEGDDKTGDGSESNPWKTISFAIENIKEYHTSVAIKLVSGKYPEHVSIRRTNTPIALEGPESGVASVYSLYIGYCAGRVQISNLHVNDESNTVDYGISILFSKAVYLNTVNIIGKERRHTAIELNQANAYIVNPNASNCKHIISCIYGSNAYIANYGADSTNNNNVIDSHSSIVLSGILIPSDIADSRYITRGGGIIFDNGIMVGNLIENPSLTSGWKYESAFSDEKSSLYRDGKVIVGHLQVKSVTDYSGWKNILNLPAGFRPAYLSSAVATTNSDTYVIYIYKSGDVQCPSSIKAGTALNINFTYLAAN